MRKIGISASFFHADPARPIFKGMTLQYIEQNLAHWLMQRDVLAFMVPSPDGSHAARDSKVTLDAYADALDGLVLMGGSDVAPESYGEQAIKPEWSGDRVRDQYEIGLLQGFHGAQQAGARRVPRRAGHQRRAWAARCGRTSPRRSRTALNHRNWAIYEKNAHATSLVPGSGLARLYPGLRRSRRTRSITRR